MSERKILLQVEVNPNDLLKRINESLNIPALWSPETKLVMSGLGKNSNGNGTKSNSVIHVVLREVLSCGKLHRKAYQYLCSQPELKYMSHIEFWGDNSPKLEDYEVDCKQCLKVCERFK